jgi:hypothetical protein
MNILYSVYVKYKVWFIIDKPSEKNNYKLFINDDGAEIHTEWEIKNLRRYLEDISDDQISY